MSSAQVAAKKIKQLDPEDIGVLKSIEKSMGRYESIPLSNLERILKFSKDKLLFRLGRLNAFGFIVGSEHGYSLVSTGLDALALQSLAEKGLISGMGRSIGMGKESDVYEVVSDSGERLVIKFYRIGRVSFRATRLKRSYSNASSHHQWLEINVNAAEKEQEGLEKALKVGVTSPKFVARDRHAVLMSEIEGIMLHQCAKDDVKRPKRLLREIFGNARKAYIEANMINGDLSEYNILYDGEKPWIIDWPQYVLTDHPNANEILERDVNNTLSYFHRKFGASLVTAAVVNYVKGLSKKL